MVIKKDANNGLQALADVGLPNGKTDLVELEQFTFDKFYKIYQTICPRSSIVNKTGNRDINIFAVDNFHESLLHRFHIFPSVMRIPYDTTTSTMRKQKNKSQPMQFLSRNDIDELFRSITGGQRDMIDCAKH